MEQCSNMLSCKQADNVFSKCLSSSRKNLDHSVYAVHRNVLVLLCGVFKNDLLVHYEIFLLSFLILLQKLMFILFSAIVACTLGRA